MDGKIYLFYLVNNQFSVMISTLCCQIESMFSYINYELSEFLIKKIINRTCLCHLDCGTSLELLFLIIK